MVTAVVGAGGKTTLVWQMARAYRAQGRRVLVTTSTHMYAEAHTLLDPTGPGLAAALRQNGLVMAGSTAPEGKIGPLAPAVYAAGCAAADEVLVEADGARGHLVKLPGPHEPVVSDNVGRIVLVLNLKAEGLPLCQAAHHPERVAAALGVPEDAPLTAGLLRQLAAQYAAVLRARWPDKPLFLHLNARPDQQALVQSLTETACSGLCSVLQWSQL